MINNTSAIYLQHIYYQKIELLYFPQPLFLIMFVTFRSFARTSWVSLDCCCAKKRKMYVRWLQNLPKKSFSFLLQQKKVSSTFIVEKKNLPLLRWPCKYIPWYSARSPPFFTNFIQRTFFYKAQCSKNGKIVQKQMWV